MYANVTYFSKNPLHGTHIFPRKDFRCMHIVAKRNINMYISSVTGNENLPIIKVTKESNEI